MPRLSAHRDTESVGRRINRLSSFSSIVDSFPEHLKVWERTINNGSNRSLPNNSMAEVAVPVPVEAPGAGEVAPEQETVPNSWAGYSWYLLRKAGRGTWASESVV